MRGLLKWVAPEGGASLLLDLQLILGILLPAAPGPLTSLYCVLHTKSTVDISPCYLIYISVVWYAVRTVNSFSACHYTAVKLLSDPRTTN